MVLKEFDNHTKQFYILRNGQRIYIPEEEILKPLEVKYSVRIPIGDYPKDIKPGKFYYHFGMFVRNERRGDKFVIAKIIEHGQMVDGLERDPLLDFTNTYVGEMTLILPDISLEDIPSWCYAGEISTIADVHSRNDIARLIDQRYYANTLERTPDDAPLSQPEEKVYQHLSVRQFVVGKPVSV